MARCQILGYSEPELLSLETEARSALPTHCHNFGKHSVQPNRSDTLQRERVRSAQKRNRFLCGGHRYVSQFTRGNDARWASSATSRNAKQAEEALRQAKSGTTWLCEEQVLASGTGIFVPASVYFSPRWRTFLGYGENEIGGNLEDWTGLLDPDDHDWILKFRSEFPQARRSRSRTSSDYVTRTAPIAGSWPTHLSSEMNTAGRADSSVRMGTLRIADGRKRLWSGSGSRSGKCSRPATTNDRPSPTRFTMASPSILPLRTCSCRYSMGFGKATRKRRKGF